MSDTPKLVSTSAFVTRPSGSATYALGNAIANDAVAANVKAMQFNLGDQAGGTFEIFRSEFWKSKNTLTLATFRLHLFASDPATDGISSGDNAAFSVHRSSYRGSIDFDLTGARGRQFIDAAQMSSSLAFNTEIGVVLEQGQILYGLVEARAAYAADSLETFNFRLWARKLSS